MRKGDLVKVKGTRQIGLIVIYGRNQCKVKFGADPELYADLDTLVSEERWVETGKLQPVHVKK
jgi:hypothetical protein